MDIVRGTPSEERDRDYHRRRAEQEFELARQSSDPDVVAAHYRLAELHLERLSATEAGSKSDESCANRA